MCALVKSLLNESADFTIARLGKRLRIISGTKANTSRLIVQAAREQMLLG